MQNENGWIKLHRGLLKWEWISEPLTAHLFMYLLLKANHKASKWRGETIERGQVLTGRKALAKETGLTEQQVRTALKRLKSTSELTIKSTSQFSVISICNYEKYQDDATNESTSELTNEQPASNQQVTTNKKNKKNKNIRNNTNVLGPEAPKTYGNEDINKILEALKAKIGISDFADGGKWARIYGKHCFNLMQKLGVQEFARRLDLILKDDFKRKNCNSIKYVYNQIKGFIEPKTNTIPTF